MSPGTTSRQMIPFGTALKQCPSAVPFSAALGSHNAKRLCVGLQVGGPEAALFDYARGGPQWGADALIVGPPQVRLSLPALHLTHLVQHAVSVFSQPATQKAAFATHPATATRFCCCKHYVLPVHTCCNLAQPCLSPQFGQAFCSNNALRHAW